MRRVVPILLTTIFLLSFTNAAHAQSGGSDFELNPPDDNTPPTPTIGDSSVSITVSFREDLRVVNSQSGTPGRQAKCGFFDVSGDQFYTITLVAVVPEERDLPYVLHCWYLDGTGSVPGFPTGYVCCTPGLPGTTVVNEYDVAEHAANNINFALPAIETSPANEQVVGVRTWLAVTSQLNFAAVTARAGPIWATVEPRFREAQWDLGNGDTVTCTEDATLTWDPNGGDNQTTECGYVFTTNLEGDPFQGSVTVTWDIFWTYADPNNAGAIVGPAFFGEISQTSPVTFNVRELQAVID